jgi:hypothetical protein
MILAEGELSLVLNRADAEDGLVLASSTWPRWTAFLDRLVAAGVATREDIRDHEGRRLGGRYRVNADALTVVRRRRARKLSDAELARARDNAARARNARKDSTSLSPSQGSTDERAQEDSGPGVKQQQRPDVGGGESRQADMKRSGGTFVRPVGANHTGSRRRRR